MNYDALMRERIESICREAEGCFPRLLLHVCCAPCSSYCLELLRDHFDVTVFYYNPNITDEAEYLYRRSEETRLIAEYNRQVDEKDMEGMRSTESARRIDILDAPYDPGTFLENSRGLETVPEGGERCERCFSLRLGVTAKTAAEQGFDFFTTTLTISPQKDAALLNRIGMEKGEEYGVAFLPSDFKKKDGNKRSVELSARFSLYRQNYCGCSFSKASLQQRSVAG